MRPLPDIVPSRVSIERLEPEVDAGRFAAKRTVGDEVLVSADIYADGHEVLAGVLRYRRPPNGDWYEVGMTPKVNDRWTATFTVTEIGWYEYTVQAWIDPFATWRRDLKKKFDAGQNVESELLEGAVIVQGIAKRAGGADGDWLRGQADSLMRGAQGDRMKVA